LWSSKREGGGGVAGRDRLIRDCFRERFLITMRGGETFDGLLLEADDRTVVLVNASAVEGTTRHRVDGALYLPRGDVAYMQKPGVAG
jgi:hypothetical protein